MNKIEIIMTNWITLVRYININFKNQIQTNKCYHCLKLNKNNNVNKFKMIMPKFYNLMKYLWNKINKIQIQLGKNLMNYRIKINKNLMILEKS